MAFGGINHSLLGDWIDSAVRQRRSHRRQILGAHIQGALSVVEIDCLGGIEIDPIVNLEQTGNASVAIIAFGRGQVNFFIQLQSAPGEPRQTFMNKSSIWLQPFDLAPGWWRQSLLS